MLLKGLGAGLLILILYALYKALITRYYTHWKPWVGAGWMLKYDHETKQVTVETYLLKSPAGRSGIKRGSILLVRDGQEVPVFETKEEFPVWAKSLCPRVGRAVLYRFLVQSDQGDWQQCEVTLCYEKLRGIIPHYAPLPTYEQMHQDWKRLMPSFKAAYPTYFCPRTGVIYHRVRIIPVDEFS